MRLIVITALLMFSNLSVSSGYNSDTLISDVQVGADSWGSLENSAYITVSSIITPKCNDTKRMYIDLDTSLGKAQLSVALTAFTTKQSVMITGAESCITDNVTIERLKSIKIK